MTFLKSASAATVALLLSLAPASAQWNDGGWNNNYYNGWNGNQRGWNQGWNNGWNGGWNNGWHKRGWNSRNVSDPSFSSRRGYNAARRSGRCVVDLGYGRYESCDR